MIAALIAALSSLSGTLRRYYRGSLEPPTCITDEEERARARLGVLGDEDPATAPAAASTPNGAAASAAGRKFMSKWSSSLMK